MLTTIHYGIYVMVIKCDKYHVLTKGDDIICLCECVHTSRVATGLMVASFVSGSWRVQIK